VAGFDAVVTDLDGTVMRRDGTVSVAKFGGRCLAQFGATTSRPARSAASAKRLS
jgi:hypothetical protein